MLKNCFWLVVCFLAMCSARKRTKPPHMPVGPFDPIKERGASPEPNYIESGQADSELFQGDIRDSGRRKNAAGNLAGEAGTRTPWPNGIIPYVFDCSVLNIKSAMEATRRAMKEWESNTCVRFVEKRPEDKVYLEFFRSAGCWATFVGYKGKKVQVSIGYGCEYKHVMVHELGHVIGFWHEQSRPDRDRYITINYRNVIANLKYNFDIVKEQTNSYGEPYDYGSIMHYPWNAFAINRRRKTIYAKRKTDKTPYVKLSRSDITQTNRMYKCDEQQKRRLGMAKMIKDVRKKVGSSFAGPKCSDGHDSCRLWAKHGHCHLAADPMLLLCAKSCANCGKCVDNHKLCPAWVKMGHCLRTPRYMLRHCKKSCLVCRPETTKAPKTTKPTTKPTTEPTTKRTTKPTTKATTTERTTRPTPKRKIPSVGGRSLPNQKYTGIKCVDRSSHCRSWAKNGRCKTDRWVYINCMVSCKRYDICDRKPVKPRGRCTELFGVGWDGRTDELRRDYKFYATSFFQPGSRWRAAAHSARLYNEDDHTRKYIGAWCAKPKRINDGGDYLQINFPRTKWVTGLASQGRPKYFEHVKSYYLKFLIKGRWVEYKEWRKRKVFEGNCDHFTPVINLLRNPARTTAIRIYPIKYSGAKCMRVELYGCNA